jgi:Bacterial Ig domain
MINRAKRMKRILGCLIVLLVGCGGGGSAIVGNSPATSSTAKLQAVNDVTQTYNEASVLIDVLANDLSTSAISIMDVAQPEHGRTTLENGQIRYLPNPGFFGTDNFRYSVRNAEGLTSAATAYINSQIFLRLGIRLPVRTPPSTYSVGIQVGPGITAAQGGVIDRTTIQTIANNADQVLIVSAIDNNVNYVKYNAVLGTAGELYQAAKLNQNYLLDASTVPRLNVGELTTAEWGLLRMQANSSAALESGRELDKLWDLVDAGQMAFNAAVIQKTADIDFTRPPIANYDLLQLAQTQSQINASAREPEVFAVGLGSVFWFRLLLTHETRILNSPEIANTWRTDDHNIVSFLRSRPEDFPALQNVGQLNRWLMLQENTLNFYVGQTANTFMPQETLVRTSVERLMSNKTLQLTRTNPPNAPINFLSDSSSNLKIRRVLDRYLHVHVDATSYHEGYTDLLLNVPRTYAPPLTVTKMLLPICEQNCADGAIVQWRNQSIELSADGTWRTIVLRPSQPDLTPMRRGTWRHETDRMVFDDGERMQTLKWLRPSSAPAPILVEQKSGAGTILGVLPWLDLSTLQPLTAGALNMCRLSENRDLLFYKTQTGSRIDYQFGEGGNGSTTPIDQRASSSRQFFRWSADYTLTFRATNTREEFIPLGQLNGETWVWQARFNDSDNSPAASVIGDIKPYLCTFNPP